MEKLTELYNQYIVAQWYKSWAMWLGVLAAALPWLADNGQALLDNLGLFGDALALTPTTQARIQIALMVLIPIARAWKQQSMQDAAKLQEMRLMQAQLAKAMAEDTGDSVTPKGD